MNPMSECLIIEFERRLPVGYAERLGPYLADLEHQPRWSDRRRVSRGLRQRLGAALVAAGTRLQGAQRVEPARTVPGGVLGISG
jgi:hypothetical protein